MNGIAGISTPRADPESRRTIKVNLSREVRIALHASRILHGETISGTVATALETFFAERAAARAPRV